jgi:hypothetical protein
MGTDANFECSNIPMRNTHRSAENVLEPCYFFAAFIFGNELKFSEQSRSLLGGTKEENMASALELIRPLKILTVRDSKFSHPREI